MFEVDEAFAPEEESLDALSMPRPAAQLDVGVTSIYWCFKSKEDLLDALAEQAMVQFYAELHVPAGLAWEEHLREFFREFRRVFQANKVLNDLIITRTGNVTEKAFTAAFERVEEVLRALVDAGFTRDDAMYGYSALSVYTRGALFIERGYQAAEQRPTVRRPTSDGLAHIPLISDVASRHTLVMTDEDDVEFGLENAIRGLQVLLAEHRAGQPEPSAS
ncbi:MAG: TetR family transcriptional regulator [Modestobacter sp.]|nr:TetR family transcriptional regulator [Modestobacter sp.]